MDHLHGRDTASDDEGPRPQRAAEHRGRSLPDDHLAVRPRRAVRGYTVIKSRRAATTSGDLLRPPVGRAR
jgi:hypothetical protein